jgi:hypothetical protein
VVEADVQNLLLPLESAFANNNDVAEFITLIDQASQIYNNQG